MIKVSKSDTTPHPLLPLPRMGLHEGKPPDSPPKDTLIESCD